LLELEGERRGAGDEEECGRGEGCEDPNPGPEGDGIIGVSPDDIFQQFLNCHRKFKMN
jgi:hypothetical protein